MKIVDLAMSIELDREARLAVLGGFVEGGCVSQQPYPPICGTPVPGSTPVFEMPFVPVPAIPMMPSIESVPTF